MIAAFADTRSAILKIGIDIGRDVTPTVDLTVDYIVPALLGRRESAPVLLKATTRLMFVTANILVDGGIITRMNGIYRITSTVVPKIPG